jgi:hypothetical protein
VSGPGAPGIVSSSGVPGAVGGDGTDKGNGVYGQQGAPVGAWSAGTVAFGNGLNGSYQGAMTNGPPTVGVYTESDWIVDVTGGTPSIWVCVVAGQPGTWMQIGGSGSSSTQAEFSTQLSTAPDYTGEPAGPTTFNDVRVFTSTSGEQPSYPPFAVITAPPVKYAASGLVMAGSGNEGGCNVYVSNLSPDGLGFTLQLFAFIYDTVGENAMYLLGQANIAGGTVDCNIDTQGDVVTAQQVIGTDLSFDSVSGSVASAAGGLYGVVLMAGMNLS